MIVKSYIFNNKYYKTLFKGGFTQCESDAQGKIREAASRDI